MSDIACSIYALLTIDMKPETEVSRNYEVTMNNIKIKLSSKKISVGRKDTSEKHRVNLVQVVYIFIWRNKKEITSQTD